MKKQTAKRTMGSVLRSVILSAAALAIFASALYGRTPEEIKKNGTLVIAISENPTVYEKSDGGTKGFHYALLEMLAKRMGVRATYILAGPADLFKTDMYGEPLFFSQADIIAGHILLTPNRKRSSATVALYPTMKVTLVPGRTALNRFDQLALNKTSVLEGEDEALFASLEKKLGNKIPRQQDQYFGEQVKSLLKGSVDYLLLDSDLAFYFSKKNAGLHVGVDILKDFQSFRDVGWAVSINNPALKKIVSDFIVTIRTNGDFDRAWQSNYGIGFKEYRDTLDILDKKGDELFRNALDFAFNRQYEQSIELFRNVRNMKISSGKLQRLYDTLYLEWLTYESKKDLEKPVAILDRYMRSEPSDYFIAQLKANQPAVYNAYLQKLKKSRDESMKGSLITNAIEDQSIIYQLNRGAAGEKQMVDDLYLSYLAEKEQDDNAQAITLLDERMKEKPSPYFVKKLKEQMPGLVDDYRYELRSQRDSALRTGDWDHAVRIQESILDAEPGSFEEKNALEILKLNQKNKNSGVQEVADASLPAIVWSPSNPRAVTADQAEMRDAMKKGEKEIERLEGERYFGLGKVQFDDGDYSAALGSFRSSKSLGGNPEECSRYIDRIVSILEQKGKEEYEKKIADFNDHFARGISYYLKEDYSRALEEILACLNIFPENQQARKYSEIISDNLRIEGEKTIDEASPYFDYYNSRISAAESRIAGSQYRDAKAVLEEILTLFPNNENARQRLIFCLYKLDPQSLKKVLDDYFGSAKKLYQQGRFAEAALKFTFIKSLQPQYPEIEQYLKKSSAEKKAPPIRPLSGDSGYEKPLQLAAELYNQGKLEESLSVYKKILNRYPDDYQALVNASRIENQLKGADILDRKKYRVSENREKAEGFYLKGQFFFRLKEYRKAQAMWAKSYEIDPTYLKVYIDMQRLKKLIRTAD